MTEYVDIALSDLVFFSNFEFGDVITAVIHFYLRRCNGCTLGPILLKFTICFDFYCLSQQVKFETHACKTSVENGSLKF